MMITESAKIKFTVRAIGVIELLINGFIVLSSCYWGSLVLLKNEQVTSSLVAFRLTESGFLYKCLTNILSYGLPFVAAIGVLRFKHWGRRLLIASEVALLILLLLSKMFKTSKFLSQHPIKYIFNANLIDWMDIITIILYLAVIFFLVQPRTGKEFN